MTRHLLLLRHAKAVATSYEILDGSDHSRALAERGRLDAAAMGQQLRRRSLIPALALVSTTLRTRETLDLLGPFPGGEPRRMFLDALYLADTATLLDVLRQRGGAADSILLIGHNPGMHELALEFAPEDPRLEQGFATCTLALFAVEGEWAGLAAGQVSLLELLRP